MRQLLSVIGGSNEGMNKVSQAVRKSGAYETLRLDMSELSDCSLLQPVHAWSLQSLIQRRTPVAVNH
jgi:hypothetical protein